MPKTGGVSEEMPFTVETQSICDSVKSAAEGKTGKNYGVFRALSYRTQVVAGTIYFIKVLVGEDDYVHLRVFKSLPHEGGAVSLHSIQHPKTKEDSIDYFK